MFELSNVQLSFPSTDWARLSLVYLHLLSSAFALALVFSADWRVLKGSFSTEELKDTTDHTVIMLALLWITGALLVQHDTGMDLAVMAELSKLQLKLIVVVALTINGILLHFVSFPLIIQARTLTIFESLVLSVSGGISTSHWLLAAFVGVARPLGEWPLATLLSVYGLFVASTIVVSLCCAPFIRFHLAKRLRSQHVTVQLPVADREPGAVMKADYVTNCAANCWSIPNDETRQDYLRKTAHQDR